MTSSTTLRLLPSQGLDTSALEYCAMKTTTQPTSTTQQIWDLDLNGIFSTQTPTFPTSSRPDIQTSPRGSKKQKHTSKNE